MEYWEDATGRQASQCYVVGCDVVGRKDLVGAHVEKAGCDDNNWYIIPMCKGHNHNSNIDEFNVLDVLIPVKHKISEFEAAWTVQGKHPYGAEFMALVLKYQKGDPDFFFLIIDFSSNLERTKSYNQALSYARLMKSHILGICDKERLIIYKEKNGYFDRFKPVFERHWQALNDAEVFRQLKLLIGRETVNRIS